MRLVLDLIQLSKPRLSLLVVITAATGVWVAPGSIGWWRAAGAVFFTAVLVGATNAFNSYLERDIDGLMMRTRNRPLPAGRIEPSVALVLAVAATVASLPAIAWAANLLTAALGLVAFLVYVGVYTPMKRRSSWAMPVGAIPGAMPPLMGWTAVTGAVEPGGLALFAVLFVWQLPHFTAISLYLVEDYGRADLKVFARVHGERAAMVSTVVFTAALVPTTLALVWLELVSWIYLVTAVGLGTGLLLLALLGLRSGARLWARRVFYGTLGYLTVLMAVLVVDA